jgi:outer membrane receptor protein involved in Fe transport
MIVCLWLALQLAASGDSLVAGTVRDSAGGVVPGATVILRQVSGAEEQTITGRDGRFQVAAPIADVLLIVRASGFSEQRRTLTRGSDRSSVDVVLAPAAVSENVTVTAARGEQLTRNMPASITVLGQDVVRRSPAVVADDMLRQVPTFSLFRRTSSLASHPTAQGVSLRGIGPSGVSRTLVLLDGIPFNDPFGGWVYWTRVPLASVDRIEMVDSSSSSLYGNYAMGGVINIITAPPARRALDVRTQYGSRKSPKIDVAGSSVWGRLAVSIDGSAFDTDGYPIVAAAERGAVDNNAAVRFKTANVRLQYQFSDRIHAFLRGGHFREDRDNGKVSTIDRTEEANDTRWTAVNGGIRVRLPDGSDLQASAFVDFTRFHSNFLAVPAATPSRSVGRMTLRQAVPTRGTGGMAQWSRAIGTRQFFTAGADGRWVDGDSREDGLDAQTGTRVTLQRISGGAQRSFGVFVQDLFMPSARLTVTLSARLDRWNSYDGHNLETSLPSGLPTAGNAPSLPGRRDTVASPRAAVLYHLTESVSVWADYGYGFRAPTLNELYRQFRVGAVLTLANNQLGPERLRGGDAGIRVNVGSGVTWRATYFDNRIRDPVSNVTIATAGTSVTQQRQNLGRTRVRGVQTDAEFRLGDSWSLSAGYLYDDARVRAFESNPELVGNYLAQVPKHRGTVQAAYAHPRHGSVALTIQASGRQFDDDLNVRGIPGRSTPGLPGYALVDFTASRPLGPNLEIFFGAQNVFDREYFVGTLPTTTGTPRLVNGGVRIHLGR